MTEIDETDKQCPHCGLDGTLEQFSTWEKDGKKGFIGKTPEGHMMFLCPRCLHQFKYDPLSDSITGEEHVGLSRRVPVIIGALSIAIAAFIALFFTGWWTYFVGTFLIFFGWRSLKTGLFATNKKIADLANPNPLSKEDKKKSED